MRLPLIRLRRGSKVPVEKWADAEHRDRPASSFGGYNWAVKCGTEVNGKTLVVLDVDPRNGGEESLNQLTEEFDEFPNTFRVRTGSGGYHYYYLSDRPIGKAKLGDGLDFQGVGSYVVGPGSLHENGEFYQIDWDDPISEIPGWFFEVLQRRSRANGASAAIFDPQEALPKHEREEFAQGSRNDALASMAGALRRQGLSAEALFAALQQVNQEKCKPPLPDKEVRAIARSVARYEPAEESPPPRLEDPTRTPSRRQQSKDLRREFEGAFEMSEGLVRRVADTVLAHSMRPFPHFALASGLAVVSGAVQGAYNAPNLWVPNASGGPLSLYQWLIAPAAAGKEAYRSAVETYLRAIDPRLVCPKIGSFYGLRASLYAFNASVSVIDEMQDDMARLSNPSAGYLSQVLTEMKELTNGPEELAGVVIKDRKYPGIECPRYSVFSVGTTGGFTRHLNETMIGGGLLSRFVVWPPFEVPPRRGGLRLTRPPEDQVESLRQLFSSGITAIAQTQDYEHALRSFHGVQDRRGRRQDAPAHQAQMFPRSTVPITPEGRDVLLRFAARQDEIYRELVSDNLSNDDLSPGSLIDRSAQFAVKAAAIHAIGTARGVLDRGDALFGTRLAEALTYSLSEIVESQAGWTERDREVSRKETRVLNVLKGYREPVVKKAILWKSHIPSRELDPLLIDMASSGLVVIYNSEGEPLDMEGQTKLRRGLRFGLPG